jgi:hypothetical protein
MASGNGMHLAFLTSDACGVKTRCSSSNPAPRSQPCKLAARSCSGSGMRDGAAQATPLRDQHPHWSRTRPKLENEYVGRRRQQARDIVRVDVTKESEGHVEAFLARTLAIDDTMHALRGLREIRANASIRPEREEKPL